MNEITGTVLGLSIVAIVGIVLGVVAMVYGRSVVVKGVGLEATVHESMNDPAPRRAAKQRGTTSSAESKRKSRKRTN